jgi:membrane-associated protease RseP (regulator of RpoE activity)
MQTSKINWKLPLFLYAVTWLTTTGLRIDNSLLSIFIFYVSGAEPFEMFWSVFADGLKYSAALMLILTCHELGHFLQTVRYGVRSSLPYFIPMPFGPFGTLGAVIAMDGRIPNRRALFDIGISGPLAGLVPTLCCLYFGIQWSHIVPKLHGGELSLGEPLLLQWMIQWMFGPLAPDLTVMLHPVATAGWVGLLLTSLNLMPVGQLDGGHVLYALLGKRAGVAALSVFYVLLVLVAVYQLWHWLLVLVLLAMVGVAHPPTANDAVPLTPLRRLLGWGILAFILIGFTPTPIQFNESPPQKNEPHWYCRIIESGELKMENF